MRVLLNYVKKRSIKKRYINANKCFLAPVFGSVSHSDMMLLQRISIIFTTKVIGVKEVIVWLSVNPI